jgi:ProP effector
MPAPAPIDSASSEPVPAPAVDVVTVPADASARAVPVPVDVGADADADAPAARNATAAVPVDAVGAATVAAEAAVPAEPNPADCGARLKQLFPALFVGAPKPLKLRIQLDIQQRAPGTFTKQALSAFFRRYTGSTSYLIAVANGKQRYDLDGQPAGDIADEHRQVARDELARRRANHEQRRALEDRQRALEDQQRYNRAGLLHDYERTTLTRANFCVLKQVAEEELDGLLALAREEATQRRTAPPHAPEHRGPRHREPDRRGPERPAKPRT